MEHVHENADSTINYEHPNAFAAKATDSETYYYQQAMQQPNHTDFCKAMIKEIDLLQPIWNLVPHSNIDNKKVKAIWSFRRK